MAFSPRSELGQFSSEKALMANVNKANLRTFFFFKFYFFSFVQNLTQPLNYEF